MPGAEEESFPPAQKKIAQILHAVDPVIEHEFPAEGEFELAVRGCIEDHKGETCPRKGVDAFQRGRVGGMQGNQHFALFLFEFFHRRLKFVCQTAERDSHHLEGARPQGGGGIVGKFLGARMVAGSRIVIEFEIEGKKRYFHFPNILSAVFA